MSMTSTNWQYLEYTYLHRKALTYTILKLIKDPRDRDIMLERTRYHDLDKSLMYTKLPKKLSSKLHRENSAHHMENSLPKDEYNILEAVLDYECAALTKPDKPLNAYDTVLRYKPESKEQLLPVLKHLGIGYSYQVTPDNEFKEYLSCFLPVTMEKVMAEINDYIQNDPSAKRTLDIIQENMPE